jgi:hydroxymethylpyrimidine kinase / phosphomethylpyrimidine kinase / thiamine-phosphate diphosphorylase
MMYQALMQSICAGGRQIRSREDMQAAARDLHAMAPRAAVLVKGGHLRDSAASIDVLCDPEGHIVDLPMARVMTDNTHGTGCTLASAIAAYLARGAAIRVAVRLAQRYVAMVLAGSVALQLGWGPQGAMDHSLRICTQARLFPQLPDFRLYAVTDSGINGRYGRSLREAVTAAIAGGATMIQVRYDNSLPCFFCTCPFDVDACDSAEACHMFGHKSVSAAKIKKAP